MSSPTSNALTQSLTAEKLREMLHYDPDTGSWTWRVMRSHRVPAGSPAGSASGPGGRTLIVIEGVNHYAARLACLYMTGEYPQGRATFKNGDLADLRWENIQCRTPSQVAAESKINSLNTSGIKGVSWSKTTGKYVAMINRDGRQHYLGRFETKDAAAEAYRQAAGGERELTGGSIKDQNWATSRRQRSAKWLDIVENPSIVGWGTVEQFIEDIGEPPTDEHVLMRIRYNEPFGPGNAAWRLPWQKRAGHDDDPMQSYNLGLKYEIGVDEYERLREEQGDLCGICHQPERSMFKGVVRRLAVDHDHGNGKIRGLLCSFCNRAIGLLGDNIEIAEALAAYLRKHRT